jgi:hypothetical protein
MTPEITAFRKYINTKVTLGENAEELKSQLRARLLGEMTTSAGIAVGPPSGPVPAGQDFRKVQEPEDVEEIEVDDLEDTDDSERSGETGTQAGTTKEVKEAILAMSDAEYDSFVESLDESELADVQAILEDCAEDSAGDDEVEGDGDDDGIFYQADGNIYGDEELPDDVEEFEVDDIEDTDDEEREDGWEVQPGSDPDEKRESFRNEIWNNVEEAVDLKKISAAQAAISRSKILARQKIAAGLAKNAKKVVG